MVDFRVRFGVSLGPIHNWIETLRNRPLPHKEFNCKIKAFILKSFASNMFRQFEAFLLKCSILASK